MMLGQTGISDLEATGRKLHAIANSPLIEAKTCNAMPLRECKRVAELLLQTLLKIDGVVCTTEEERAKRREYVATINAELDRIDSRISLLNDASKM